MTYEVVAKGYSGIEIAVHNPEVLKFPTMKRFTKEQIRKAKEKGGTFFNGDLIAVVKASVRDESTLQFSTRTIKYAQHNGRFRSDKNSGLQAIYVAPLCYTADGFIVLGESKLVETDYMDKLGIPAGVLKPGDIKLPKLQGRVFDSDANLLKYAKQVAVSQIGAEPSHIFNGWVSGSSEREGNHHWSIVYVAKLPVGASELADRFKPGKFSGLEFLPNVSDAVMDFVSTNGADRCLGRSLDVLEEWVKTYNCDISNLIKK